MLLPTYAYPRLDPVALMRGMMGDFDRVRTTRPGSSFPAVNIWRGEEAMAVTAELPGVEASDIDITVKDNVLTISGERKAPDAGEDATWHRRERAYGRFTRAVRLPFDADSDKVEARFTNGVLHIVVGRPEQDRPRRIEIKAA